MGDTNVEGMKDPVFLAGQDIARSDAERERAERTILVMEEGTYNAGLKNAAKEGLKRVIEYAATHPISSSNYRRLTSTTIKVIEALKPTPSQFVELLGDKNLNVAGTAGFYLSELITKGSVNKKELRETKGFKEALARMKATRDSGLAYYADLLEAKAGMMEPVDSRKSMPVPGARADAALKRVREPPERKTLKRVPGRGPIKTLKG